MSRFRNISSDARFVGYGTPRKMVQPDEIILVQDAADVSYIDQTSIWELVDKAEKPKAEKVDAPAKDS